MPGVDGISGKAFPKIHAVEVEAWENPEKALNLPFIRKCGSSSAGRASASQAEGRGFESRLPLHPPKDATIVAFGGFLI
jgi:hypothetical protein